MRTNFFQPFIIALLIHGFMLIPLLKAPNEVAIPQPKGSSGKMTTIDLSQFSFQHSAPLGQHKTVKASAQTSTPNSSGQPQGQVQSQNSNGQAISATGGQSRTGIIFKNKPDPLYPRLAREKNLEGKVKLKAWYNSNGNIEKVEVIESSGKSLLDKASLEALKQWKLSVESPGEFEKTFEFRLKN